MGVISDKIQEEWDAQGRPASSDDEQAEGSDDLDALPESIDPFLQKYLTDEYEVDTETANQAMTAIIAVANLIK